MGKFYCRLSKVAIKGNQNRVSFLLAASPFFAPSTCAYEYSTVCIPFQVLSRYICRVAGRHADEAVRIVEATDVNVLTCLFLTVDCCTTEISGRPYLSTLKKNCQKIKIMYAEDDEWAPKAFCAQLKEDIPDLDAHVNELGLTHDFEYVGFEKMVEVLYEWITNSHENTATDL